MALGVDRDRFLLMVAALSSAWCAEPRPSETPAQRAAPERSSGEVEIDPPEETSEAEADAEEPMVVETHAASCDNDAGEVDCSAIRVRPGPTCEGMQGSCELLAKGYGYRPRVAARIAQCWTGLGARVCDIGARRSCNREAVLEACPDEKYAPMCEQIVDDCRRAGARIEFSISACTRVLSGLDDKNREWARGAMGPTREGCRLMFPVY